MHNDEEQVSAVGFYGGRVDFHIAFFAVGEAILELQVVAFPVLEAFKLKGNLIQRGSINLAGMHADQLLHRIAVEGGGCRIGHDNLTAFRLNQEHDGSILFKDALTINAEASAHDGSFSSCYSDEPLLEIQASQ